MVIAKILVFLLLLCQIEIGGGEVIISDNDNIIGIQTTSIGDDNESADDDNNNSHQMRELQQQSSSSSSSWWTPYTENDPRLSYFCGTTRDETSVTCDGVWCPDKDDNKCPCECSIV